MKKLTFEFIKDQIEKEGYELLSKEYINSQTKLKVKCYKGHEYEVTYGNFYQGYRCRKCYYINKSKKQKHSYEYIKEQIEKEGHQLLSKEYINAHFKLLLKDSKGNEFEMTWNGFQQGHRCPMEMYEKIRKTQSYSYDFIREQIEKEGYELLSKEYKNSRTKLKVRCQKGHEYEVTYGNFYQGKRCPICDAEKTSSKPEKQVLKYVKSLNLNTKIIKNDKIQLMNPKTKRMLELDIWLPELNKAIEYNGQYWHSKENVKERDKIKKQQCKEKLVDLLVIKEQDWINNKKKCLNQIKEFITC